MSSAESTSANPTPVIADAVLVKHVLGMGVIPQLQRGDSYAANAIPALVRRTLDAHNLPTQQDRIQSLVASVTESLAQKGITVKASRSLTSDATPQRVQARWRKVQQNLSAPTNEERAIVEDIAAAAVSAMHGSVRSRSSIESATHHRLSDRTDVAMSRMRVMTDAVIDRIEALMADTHSGKGGDVDALEDGSLREGDVSTDAADEYADSDPDADLAELQQLGIHPDKPSKAKPGSEQKVLELAARYAGGKDFFRPDDENDQTSPTDEEALRRARVAASTAAADRVRADLAALKEY